MYLSHTIFGYHGYYDARSMMSTVGIGSTGVSGLAVGEERSEDALDYVISQ